MRLGLVTFSERPPAKTRTGVPLSTAALSCIFFCGVGCGVGELLGVSLSFSS